MSTFTYIKRGLSPALLLLLLCAAGPGQAGALDFTLDLGGERFDPAHGMPDFGAEAGHPERLTGDPGFRLVQFDGPIQRDWLQTARATGVELVQYIHPYTYVVWAEDWQMPALAGMQSVRWTGPMLPAFKVQPHLRGLDPTLQPTMALISRHAPGDQTRRDLETAGAVIHTITPVTRHFSVVHMDLPGDRYLAAADIPAVYTVQYIRPETASRGEMSNQSVVGNYDGSNTVFTGYADWLTDTGYDGAGVVVGIVDAGIRNTHQDLAGQFTPCVSGGGSPTSCTSVNDGHGTHVAGAVAGTGASGITDSGGFLRGQGVAPGATLIEQRYPSFTGAGPGGMIPDGMLTIFRESALSGAVLTNNSWGPTGSPQGYDIPTQQIDIITRDALPEVAGNQGVLPVWSIMNGNGDSGGACAPSSVGSPDEAKNLFAVGSTKLQNTNGSQIIDIFDVSSNSGHGNACDGRLIPHIVAPGCYTDSATEISDTSHALFPYCGTSMASPVVSGAVSIFIERYRDLHDDATPSPALVKAAFTAVAQNLEGFRNADDGIMGHRPDRFQGYGRLDLDAVVNPANPVLYFDQEHVFENTGEEWSLALGAADPSQPVHIMLAWSDAPGHGMGGTTPAWVNDLDLEVQADGNLFHGNNIGGDGWSAAGGDADEMNNLEGVFLRADQHGGSLNVTVRASNIAQDALNPHDPGDPAQDFALVCYNCIIGDPTFALSVTPATTLQCRPDSGSDTFDATVNVNPVGLYTGTVDLEVDSTPALVDADLAPTSVSVPGTSALTITFENGSDAGQIVIAGDDGEDTRTTSFTLNLEDPLAAGADLIAPADEATGVGLAPTFSWDTIVDAAGYRFQLSTDAGFGTLLIDEVVSGTSFAPSSPLDTGTTHYWRVAGMNTCGDSPFGDTFTFDTAVLSDPPVLTFITSPGDADTGQTLDPVVVQIQDADGDVLDGDNSTQITMSLGNNPGGATLSGTLTRTVSAGEAVFDDLSVTAPGAGYTLHAQVSEAIDEVLAISDFSLTASQTDSQTILAGLENRGKVVGIHFDGTIAGISGSGTWASDMRMDLEGPSGSGFAVGGFGALAAPNDWEFDGSGSASDGTYASTHMDIFTSLGGDGTLDAGDWAIQFQNAYASSTATMAWSDVTVTLHKLLELEAESDPFNIEGGLPAAEVSPGSLAATLEPDQMTVLPLTIANTGDKADLVWSIETAEVDGGQQAVPPYDVPVGAARGMPAPDDQRVAPGVALPVIQGGPIDADFGEGFDDITTLPASGWALINNSSPPGANDWFQGTETFDAQAGPPTSYIVSNFQVVGGAGTASNWLLTPEVVLRNGTTMTFWTRAGENPDVGGPSNFPDRLEVRLSTAGASTDVGATATSVGDFTELLLVINEELNVGGYPIVWTQYTLEVTGLPEETSGRFAFRYFITNSGPDGVNGNFVGIDTVGITQPEVIEPCDTPGAIPWLSVDPDSGTTPAGDSSLVDVLFDASGLPQGVYEAALCVSTNDPLNPVITVPVSLNVASDGIFRDCFEEDGACN